MLLFLNSNDGTLIVGVDPNKNIIGIEKDYVFVNPKTFDGWNKYIVNKIISKYSDNTVLNNVNIYCVKLEDHDIGVIDVIKHFKPVYIDENMFYIRTSVGKRKLKTTEISDYITHNFN